MTEDELDALMAETIIGLDLHEISQDGMKAINAFLKVMGSVVTEAMVVHAVFCLSIVLVNSTDEEDPMVERSKKAILELLSVGMKLEKERGKKYGM